MNALDHLPLKILCGQFPIPTDWMRFMKTPSKLTFETILVIAAVLALVIAPLAAEAGQHHQPPTLAEFDSDGDGFLSETEFEAGRAARHAKMAEEGRAMRGMENAPTFADFDSDGDGKLSAEEFAAGHHKHMQAMKEKMHGKGEHHGHGAKPHMSFGDIDTNGDGCIDAAEFDAHHAAEKADKD